MSIRRVFGWLALIAACSPAQPAPRLDPRAGFAVPDAAAPPFASPARWAAFDDGPAPLATFDTPDGTLEVGEGGERSLRSTTTGLAGAAAELPPEPIGAVERRGGRLRMLGVSGTLYEAATPLGPIVRAGDPPPVARAVALGEQALFAIDAAGDLWRSADGRAWKKVDVPGRDGAFVGVAMQSRVGLLLAVPQRVFFTTDDGATWRVAPATGDGAHAVRADQGRVLLDGTRSAWVFEPASATFSERKGAPPSTPHRPSRAARSVAQDGRVTVVVESELAAREHAVAVIEGGARAGATRLAELDGCAHVTPAVRGKQVFLACDAPGSVASGVSRDRAPLHVLLRQLPRPDGGRETGMITKILRSDDGGRTYQEDALLEGGLPEGQGVSFFAGGDGFAYLGRRCVPSDAMACAPARVRVGGEWTDVDERALGEPLAFAEEPGQPVYSVGAAPGGAALYRWPAGARVPEQVAVLSAQSVFQAALDVEEGVARVLLRGQKLHAFEVRGPRVAELRLPPRAASAAFAGRLGLAVDDAGHGWETVDGAASWHATGMPAGRVTVVRCGELQCATSRGVRVGWDGAGAPPPAPRGPKHAKPLRCRAAGAWTALGGGQLPTAESADQGPLRWLLPTRDAPGAVTLHTNKWSDAPDKSARAALLGAAPQPPAYGAATTLYVQPEGVAVVRYSYLRARTGGAYNPVDATAAWYRPATGKIGRASAPKLPPFRVNRDPRPDSGPTPPAGEWPEIVWLGPRGLHLAAPAPGEESTVHLFRDDGKVERVKLRLDDLSGSEGRVADVGSQLVVLATEGADVWLMGTADRKAVAVSPIAGLGPPSGASLFGLGGTPSWLVTQGGDAPRAWSVPVAARAELASASPMPTQASLGETPKGCDAPLADAAGYRVVLPYTWGTRHPVLVDVDGERHVLATGGLAVHGTSSGVCAAAFDAAQILPGGPDDDADLAALLFPSDLGAALLFRAAHADWPAAISMRPMACAYEDAPLPPSLAEADGFRPLDERP